MKKISIKNIKESLMLIPLLVIFTSCGKKMLDLKNPSQFTLDTYFNTPEEIVQGANGAYISFFQFRMGGYLWPEIWDVLGNETEATAGALGSGDEIPIIQMMRYQHNETNEAIELLWRMCYMMIMRSNLVIENSERYLAENSSNDDVVRSRGEAYFLRGWAYFLLADQWGKVPIRISFDQSDNVDAPLANSAEDVWKQAEGDFKVAQSVLKDVETYSADQLGRATKGAATAYLGKLYLYNKRYKEAEDEFVKLEGHYGLLSADDYLWNFGEDNENNKESVFEFQAGQSGSNTTAMFSNVEGGALPGMTTIQPQLHSWNGWPNWKFPGSTKEGVFIYKDESGNDFMDPRGAATYYGGQAGDNVWCDRCAVDPDRPYDFANLGYYYKKKNNKEVKPTETGDGAGVGQSGNNIREIRYADVLLMRAECALLGEHDVPRSIDFINQVRRRFGIFEFTASKYSEQETFNILKHERHMEFMGEEIRYFDLKRWGILEETLNPEFQEIYGNQPVNSNHYFFPIPQGELDTNFGI